MGMCEEYVFNDINNFEVKKLWSEAYNAYVIGYEDFSNDYDFSIKYCFFCWYLISQWEQIEFKEIVNPYDRVCLDRIDGLSKSELYNKVLILSKRIIDIHLMENNVVNNSIFYHMVITFEYVFSKLNLSSSFYMEEFKNCYIQSKNNSIVKALYFKKIEKNYILTDIEKNYITNTFNTNSLMATYFLWYILC